MAKQKRKPAQSTPITAHQLFPAVVALWFGSAFGLSSLAVRASLLESLVLKSHLDLIVPAATPPLGITARILVALVMAALGAALGIALARRLSRPRSVERPRRRDTRMTRREDQPLRPRDAHPDAPARRPISAHEELDEEPEDGPGILAGRRRALTSEAQDNPFVPYEMAPLPGGQPGVLDLAEIGLDPASEASPAPAPLELGSFVEPAAAEPAPVSLDWSNAAPIAIAPAHPPLEPPAAILAQSQVFQAGATHLPDPLNAALPAHAADDRQVFGMAPPAAPASEQPRQIFGVTADGDRLPEDFVKAAGFQTTVFDQPEPSPLFAPRADAAPAPMPQAYEPPAEQQPFAAPDAEPVAAEPAAAEPAPPQPSPAGLGMTDLAVRLGDAMRRRREARAAKGAEAVDPAPSGSIEVPPLFAQAEAAPFAAAEAAEPEPAPAVAAEPVQHPAPIPVSFAPPEPIAIPAAMRPLSFDLAGEDPADPLDSLLPPRLSVMPAMPESLAPPAAAAAAAEESEAEDETANAEAYGSLLGITPAAPAANPFVRIEEPEPTGEAPEPVVIFPGQGAARPDQGADPAAAFRAFDAPSNAEQGAPSAAGQVAPAIDRDEADRALRAALANLQRMSGAA